ncbi:DNA repair protein RecO [Taibaiella lutea]|uniref:DNA repair protein RecO n=1 Tax=Taibaiella lutea TaxID=2608001 RepID=A0A5M6CW53_9BACT|nr:DNA repair protein RecO [Taibaiella lutea]KAA5537479.1 DNA repair protein RecO [Taibaiella lutea]
MVHTTRGIVLKTVKYGETSLICTVFTELLGMQSYIVKGVRSAKAKGRKANVLFAGSVLDMIVYEQANKNLQNIKEYQSYLIYQSVQEDVVKNGVALFAMEVIKQLLAAHDPQPELFEFLLNFLMQLDEDATTSIANYPLYFIIQSAKFAGYYLSGEYNTESPFADIHEGRFSTHSSAYPPFITGTYASLMSELNQASSLNEIQQIKMTAEERKTVLQYFLSFLQLHVPHFKELKTIAVLTAIFY